MLKGRHIDPFVTHEVKQDHQAIEKLCCSFATFWRFDDMILSIYAILLGFEQKVVVWMDGGYLKPVKPIAPCGLLAACNAEQSHLVSTF